MTIGAETRPGWARADGQDPLCPLFARDLLELRAGRLGVICVLLLAAIVGATRAAVLPASVWDRDEAHLGLAVVHFDPAADRPHAPWFPLWVMVGKLAAPIVSEPARGLQVVSALLGAWSLFPLAALLSIWLRRRTAAAAAVLYLLLPGPWFLSARAYSDTPATFLLLLAAAWWLRPEPEEGELLSGSVAAALCLLVRPQHALVVAALAAWCWFVARDRRARLLLVMPIVLAVVAAAMGLLVATGSVGALIRSLSSHLRYHLDGLSIVDHGFAASGLSRALIRPELALVWIALVGVGVVAWRRHRRTAGQPWPLLVAGLAPSLLTALLLSDPTQTRYALPLLALSTGPVVIGLASLFGRGSLAVIGLAVAVSLAVGLPQARGVRTTPSPVISALRCAGQEAAERDGVVVVDRTLRVFADYSAESGLLEGPVLTDFSLEIGAAAIPPAAQTVAVFDRGHGEFVAAAERTEVFRCRTPWPRRLGPDRFLDVTMASGARVVRAATPW